MTLCCDLKDDTAAIGFVLLALDQPRLLAALAEFDDAVMAQPEPLGYVRYGCFDAVRGSGDVQQELVLLGMEACFGGAGLAEMEKLAQGVAELG